MDLKDDKTKSFRFWFFCKGDQDSKSDIDILIQYSPDAKKSLFTWGRLKNELEDALQKEVDVITEKSLPPVLRETVLKEKRDIL